MSVCVSDSLSVRLTVCLSDVLLVKFMYLVVTRTLSENYRRRFQLAVVVFPAVRVMSVGLWCFPLFVTEYRILYSFHHGKLQRPVAHEKHSH